MKLTKSYIKQLIRESIDEVVRMDPREDPEGTYGVDPTGELSREARNTDDEGPVELKFNNWLKTELAELIVSEDHRAILEAIRDAYMATYGETPESSLK